MNRSTALCIAFSCFLTACKTTGGVDTTAPGLAEVLVRVESTTPPTVRGEFNITSADVNKTAISPSLTLRVIATAGDSESGIASAAVTSELRWRCAFGSGSPTIGIYETKPLVLTPALTQPSSPPPAVWQLNVAASPIAQTGCPTGQVGHGPVDIDGFVRVSVTNGAGMTTTSRTFLFEYQNVGVK